MQRARRIGAVLATAPAFALVAVLVFAGCQAPAPPRPAVAPAAWRAAPTPEVPIDRADAWEDVWRTLERRPLRLPAAGAGTCPVSPVEPIVGRHGLGDGPVYAVVDPAGVVRYGGGEERGGWTTAKVLWLASPWYRGPALVRGRQLDGPNEVVFPRAEGEPATALRFPIWTGVGSPDVPEGWRQQPSWLGFRASGCYAVQIDGISFSRTLVFAAEP